MCVIQGEGTCLHTAGFGSFVSFPQVWHVGWRSFRVDAVLKQHQEPEKCWCCSEGVDVIEMVSVVLVAAAERDSGLSCLRVPGFGWGLTVRPA